MKTYKSTIPEITLKYKSGDIKKVQIHNSNDAAEYLKEMYDMDTIEIFESFIVVYFNRANNSIGWFKVSQGGITGTVVDNRLIVGTALKCGASSMIISHNHPSGNLRPSENDKSVTRKLQDACKLFDICILDHVIMTPNNGYFSFADEGLL